MNLPRKYSLFQSFLLSPKVFLSNHRKIQGDHDKGSGLLLNFRKGKRGRDLSSLIYLPFSPPLLPLLLFCYIYVDRRRRLRETFRFFPLSHMGVLYTYARTEMHFLRKQSMRVWLASADVGFVVEFARSRRFLSNKVGSPSSPFTIWVIIVSAAAEAF